MIAIRQITGDHLRQTMIWGLMAMLVLVPLVFSSMFREYATPKMVLAQVMVIGLAILWLLSMVRDGEIYVVDTSLYYTLIAFLAMHFVSLFLAHNMYEGLDTLFHYASFFAVAVLVFHVVQASEDMIRLAGTMVLTGGIVATIGLLQHNQVFHFYAPWSLPVSTIGNVNFTAQYYNVVFPISLVMLFACRRFWAQVGVPVPC